MNRIFVIAGHDMTANTMAWLLYELSLHLEDQAKICEEIAQTKLNVQEALTSNDYDSMVWLNACIKVGCHSMIYWKPLTIDSQITIGSSLFPSPGVCPIS